MCFSSLRLVPLKKTERDLSSTFNDLSSLDSLPKCLTCSHQSPTLTGSPEDKETMRGGEGGEGRSECAAEDEREN